MFTFLTFLSYGLSTGVGEHLRDLRSESRDDCGVKEGVKSCQKNTSDNHANDDLDTGIDVALTLLGFEYGLCGDCNRVDFVFDSVDELFHLFFICINCLSAKGIDGVMKPVGAFRFLLIKLW